MLSRFKYRVGRVYADVLGKPTVWLLSKLAKSQVSANVFYRALGYIPFQITDRLLGVNALRLISYVSFRPQRERRPRRVKDRKLSSYLYLAVGPAHNNSAPSPEEFRAALAREKFDGVRLYNLAHQMFGAGQLALACEAFQDLLERELPLDLRLQALRDAGIACFMLGKIAAANHYWHEAGWLRRFILGPESGPIYRILGGSWFVAIGHLAMLGMYVKYNKLYRGPEVRVVAPWDMKGAPVTYLCERLASEGITFLPPGEVEGDYNVWAKRHGKRQWDQLSAAERAALYDDFWEFEFPDGDVLGYTHAAARVEQEWERQQRPPLLSVTPDEQRLLVGLLQALGLPKGAWYVCLHVREPGFHQSWNARYPSMRDANIDDYLPAVKYITDRGAWVIRVGDSSMKPLPPMPNVIDYAHSPMKSPNADVLITQGCRFYLGTNSGLATIPATYGVRCVLSNWVPIGLPLWPSRDLLIPKLFYDEQQGRCLTLAEVFATGLAFIQNWSDLPAGITLKDNTPDEICELAAEALDEEPDDGEFVPAARAAYKQIAVQYGGYVGSRLASSFIRRHQALFPPGPVAGATNGNRSAPVPELAFES
jgi:putative glycosyltransferase (TIGR04372 family)